MISKRNFTQWLAGSMATATTLVAPRAVWAQARGTAVELAGYQGADRQQRLVEGAKKEGPLASETLLVFAGSWVESVAMDPSKPPAEREKLLAQARQFYQEVLRRDANNVDALLGLGQMYLVTGEREPLALVEKKARELHPTNAKVWAWIAVRRARRSKPCG